MYTLTLTRGERKAFDCVGDRYANGNDMASLLEECMGPDEEWTQDGDITFNIPESVAWAIADFAQDDDNLWPCFDHDLMAKMVSLVDSIV